MKSEVKLPVIILIGIIVLGLCYVGFTKMMKVGDLDQGQVKYTPGVPPWQETDPSKKATQVQTPQGGPGAPGAASPGKG